MKTRLFTPGPTPVPERVALRMAAPLIHHRTDDFRRLLARVHENLRMLFQTAGPVLPLTCSGTGAMEALVVNLFSPGETVLTVNGGKFGARWTELARTFGLRPVELTVPWGAALSPAQLQESLRAVPAARGVFLTHCETSTGTAVDLRALAATVRGESSALLCVDGISSVGAHELRFDAWGIDACVCGSQKGMMIPPGLAFAALSARAVAAVQASSQPRFYFDLRRALASSTSHDTPWTPAVTLLTGADEALEMIREEGLEAVWRRHLRHAAAVRAGLTALGLRLFSSAPSHALTAVWLPDGVAWKDLQRTLRTTFGVVVAGGQGEYAGRIFRVAHLGYYDDLDIITLVAALEGALAALGCAAAPGAAVAAAQRELASSSVG